MQIVEGDHAAQRVHGEYSCMFELCKTMLSIVPTPRGWERCIDSDTYYYLCDFVDITHCPPESVKLSERTAELHQRSVSPTGMFGFHVVPYDGKLPLMAEWDSSWSSFYHKNLQGVYEHDIRVNGLWKELDDAMQVILRKWSRDFWMFSKRMAARSNRA